MPTQIIDILGEAARLGGDEALRLQPTVTVTRQKDYKTEGAVDDQTSVDVAAGTVIRDFLSRWLTRFPVLSEEQPIEERDALLTNSSRYVLVDENDGTSDLQCGGDDWGPIIGLIQDGVLTHSAMYQPKRKRMVTATRGSGTFLNRNRVTLKGSTTLAKGMASVILHKSYTKSWLTHIVQPLIERTRGVRTLGSTISGLVNVLEGRFLAHTQAWGRFWDYGGILAIEEAGGKVTQGDGSPLIWGNKKMSILAARSPEIHAEVLEITQSWSGYEDLLT